MKADPAVDVLHRCLSPRTDVRLALLFGSRARGTATAASDVDLAVRAPDADLLRLGAELSSATGHEVDVVELDGAGLPLLERVVQDGVVVHEARRGAAALWRARALATLETDRRGPRRRRSPPRSSGYATRA